MGRTLQITNQLILSEQAAFGNFRRALRPADQQLLDEIERRTGLSIALEGFYKWIAFLPA